MSPPCVFYGPAASCYHLYGADALTYLQSQVTVNVPTSEEKAWAYGLWLNENGRVLADSFVYVQANDSCLVWSYDCPSALLENTIRRNIVADEVEISDLRKELSFTTLTGEGIDSILEAIGYPIPESGSVIETEDYFQYKCGLSDELNTVFIGPASFHSRLHESLKAVYPEFDPLPFDHELRHFKRAEACVPIVPQDIGEHNIPQEGNFKNSAIDFTKGCFPGQEIMASFRKTGRLNKALFRFRIPQVESIGQLPLDIRSGNLVVGRLTTLAGNKTSYRGLGIIRLRAVDRSLHIMGSDEQSIPIEIVPLQT